MNMEFTDEELFGSKETENNKKRFLVTISGSKVMFDAPDSELIDRSIHFKNKRGKQEEDCDELFIKEKNISHKDLAKRKMYYHPEQENVAGIPAINLLSALKEAGKEVLIATKMPLTKRNGETRLYRHLEIKEFFIPIEGIFKVDCREGAVPAKAKKLVKDVLLKNDKMAILKSNNIHWPIIIRPKFFNWSAIFTIEIDTGTLNEEKLNRLLQIAGEKVGIGSYRPDAIKHKHPIGPFGKFKATITPLN